MPVNSEEVQKHSVHTLIFRSLKRTHDMFVYHQSKTPPDHYDPYLFKMDIKAKSDYSDIVEIALEDKISRNSDQQDQIIPLPPSIDSTLEIESKSLVPLDSKININQSNAIVSNNTKNTSINPMLRAPISIKPVWHPPWKLYRVISGHFGWVRCVDVEPGNEWFATGASDRIIKIWDLATGTLKLSLTGHVSGVRGVVISPRQPYLFSCGEDKQVKCWDLEYNKVIRHYHGHLSAVYCLSLHPTIDVLVSGGRDSVVRVWDMRTKACIHILTGHSNTVGTLFTQGTDPQIISGSHDSTIRLWDISSGRSISTLTHHKKSVRALAPHPRMYMFASGSPDNIKQWSLPKGDFMQNMSGHNSIVNTISINEDNVLVSGGDNGSLLFWDWKSGHCFQRMKVPVQPGSIESESAIFASKFDISATRLITCDADKTIKMYKEDDEATEETHPLIWKPELLKRKRY
ncbi:pleiotropic regulator 1-like [Gordionus sp. m RMFG-2023]|uniref:pleiotropic regulator 1-like n=1 Tax=Gordionus sp. m RMFG-2023 TaxID=3053472 RepID=UPI0031FCEBB5